MMRTFSGRRTVATIGQVLPLSDVWAGPIASLDVVALDTNTSLIYIGAENTVAAVGSQCGIPMRASDVMHYENVWLKDIFIDARVAGEGVTFGGTYEGT